MANKLFVGNLPPDCTAEDLRTVFNTYGTTTDIHLMAGKSSSGQSCAFVVYETAEAGETAILTLDNKYSIREGATPIQVKWANSQGTGGPPATQPAYVAPPGGGYAPTAPSYGAGYGAPSYGGGYTPPQSNAAAGYSASYSTPSYGAPSYGQYPPATGGAQGGGSKLFVGNLPTDIQEEAIKMVFSTYGNVTNIHIMAGKSKSGQSCAFVEYSSPMEAETAILTLHEKYEIRPGAGNILVKHATNSSRPRPY
jgi:hypothetical protein